MQLDRTGLEILSRDECLALLAAATIGRIAVTVDALPVVLPVNFVVADGSIFIRTAPGTKLQAATRQSVVAFEVDAIDAMYHAGWSVLVTGPAQEVTDPDELRRARRLPLRAWGLGDEADVHFVRIDPTLVSGRRLPARLADQPAVAALAAGTVQGSA